MATWDVFRSDRLEIERALSTEAVRAALARGDLHDDDLIRPAGTAIPWARLTDLPDLIYPPAGNADALEFLEDEDEPEVLDPDFHVGDDRPGGDAGLGRLDLDLDRNKGDAAGRLDLSSVEMIALGEDEDEDEDEGFDPLEEDDDAVEFTLARDESSKIEELDLAAMVDVAFQLVLFFLVTAWNVVVFKSLEVPKPNPETPAAGATQGKAPRSTT